MVTSPGKWSPVPRANGPEFLARWADLSGYWRVAVYRRDWRTADSVYTDVPASGPRPGDQWLGQLGFVTASEDGWAEVDGGWEQAVTPARGD